MPTFPIEKQLISTDVSGISTNPRQAGIIQESIGQLGGQLADTSMKLIQQIRTAEAKDAAQQAHHEDGIETGRWFEEAKLANPDGYMKNPNGGIQTNLDGTPVTLSQGFHEWADQRYKANQDKMPSELAQQLYREKSGDFFTSQIVAAFTQENKQKIETFRAGADQRDQSRVDSLSRYASPEKVYELSNASHMDRMEQTGPGNIFDINETKTQSLKVNQKLAEGAGKYAIQQAMATPGPRERSGDRVKLIDQWMTWINEDPNGGPLTREAAARKAAGLPILSEMFDPDNKASILHALQQAKISAKAHDKSSVDLSIKEYGAFKARGGDSPQVAEKLMGDIVQQVNAGDRSPEEGAHSLSQLAMYDQLQKLPQSIDLLPFDAQKQQFRLAAKPALDAAQRFLGNNPALAHFGSMSAEVIDKVGDKRLKDNMEESKKDWADYLEKRPFTPSQEKLALFQKNGVTMTDPRTLRGMGQVLNAEIEASKSRYDQLYPGHPEHFRYMTKAESEQMASFFNDPAKIRTPEDQAVAIRTMAREYGSNFPKVMQQMIEDGHLKAPMMFAANLSGSQIQTQDLLRGLLHNDADSEESKAFLANKSISDNDLTAALGKKFSAFITAASQRNPGDPFAQMGRDGIIKAAKNMAVMNLKDGRADNLDTAATQAYEALVDQNWYMKQSSAPGIMNSLFRSYNMLVPKQIGSRSISDGDAQTIADFSRNILTPDWLRVLGVVPFTGPGQTPSNFSDQFYKQISSENARIVVNPKSEALEIWMHDKYNHVDRAVLVEGGHPLSIPIEKALQYKPGDTPMSTYDSNKESIPGAAPAPLQKFMPDKIPNSSSKNQGFDFIKSANASTTSDLGPERDPNAGDSPLNKNIQFKQAHFRLQLQEAHASVRNVVNDIAGELQILGDKAVVSRVTDPVKGESGVHRTGRAVDISTRQLDKKTINALVTTMNMRYPRYDGFPTVIYHKMKGGVYHLHVQVPPDERRFANR